MLIWANISAEIHLLYFLCLQKHFTFTQNTVHSGSQANTGVVSLDSRWVANET